MDEPASPPSAVASRTVDIELGDAEVITVDLDDLDASPDDLLDLLNDGRCTDWGWTRLAAEYWTRGNLDAAERIASAALRSYEASRSPAFPPIYALLANVQIARARAAPKLALPNPRQDNVTKEKRKDELRDQAVSYLNLGESTGSAMEGTAMTIAFLTRGIQQLAANHMDEAFRSFDGVLNNQPNNLVALLGKARVLYARRSYPQALKLFQRVLALNPRCLPDPRIGIGLCLWSMDHKPNARAAWQRSLEVNPSGFASQLLLGLDSINASKDDSLTDIERKHAFVDGTKLVERAWAANKTCAATANALFDLFLAKRQYKMAIKLAERTIQFADTLTILTEGYIRAGRVCHAEDLLQQAAEHFTAASEGQKTVIGSIGLAQVQLKKDGVAGAIHALDNLAQPPNAQKSLEATAMLASLRAHPRPGISSAEVAKDKARAQELYDVVCKALQLHGHAPVSAANGHRAPPHKKGNLRLVQDLDMHAEIAALWQTEDPARAKRALAEAITIGETLAQGTVDPRFLNNLGVLHHIEEDFVEARRLYEVSLTVATGESLDQDLAEGISTTVLYNLARAYEDSGLDSMAQDAYDKLLARHPEYVDAKIRQAHMLTAMNRHDDAHHLIKQALTSQATNPNVRAFYTHFLIQTNNFKAAKDFLFQTFKDHDKHDVYSLCAAGWIQYHQARETRDATALQERRRGFQRSAEFYEKALHLDPLCAVAAQGLAIVTAEDALGTMHGAFPPGPVGDEGARRVQDARDALDVFGKVRETVNDGSVYINMGHCYYARDEFDRAIESYETASKRYYDGHNVAVLLCLCRSWYAKSSKEISFPAMNTALRYAQQALHLNPQEKATMYNIAMIEQKAAEMLFSIPPAKRTLKDLERAIDQAGHAQKLFASMTADKAEVVPWSREMTDQRRKYGDSMLRKGAEHLATQRQYEDESRAKLDAARQKREQALGLRKQAEESHLAELKLAAEKLAEERRIAREQAQEWTREVKMESDEEREKRAKRASKKAAKGEAGSGDEGEPKKKRRIKKKAQEGEEDEEALFSADEDVKPDTKPKKRANKRVVRDEDEDEPTSAAPRKKQFKSKELIEDSDEEMA